MKELVKYILLAVVAGVFAVTNPTFEQHLTVLRDRAREASAKEGGVKAVLGKLLLHNVVLEQMVEYSDFKVFGFTRLKEDGSLATIGVLGIVF